MKESSKIFHLLTYSLKCSKNLKLRNQLIIIVSVQVLIIFSLAVALNITHHEILDSYFSDISNTIFETSSNRMITSMLNSYEDYFDRVFYLNGNALISFHRLYHVSRKQVLLNTLKINNDAQMLFGGTTNIPDPVRIIKGYGSNDISYSFMCYSNVTQFSNPKTLDEQIGVKIQEYIQAYGQMIYQGQLINQSFLYSYIISERINSIYPCLNRGSGIYQYIPEKRDWYKELKKNYESKQPYSDYSYTFTTPYLLYTYKTIGLSLCLPIVNEKLELIGGVASNFLGTEIVTNLATHMKGFSVIYLVSNEGIMIMHPYHVTIEQLPLYIYNQTITGFNKTDWDEINSDSRENSLCLKFNQPLNLKCRYNSYYEQIMIIGVQEISDYDMKLITYTYIYSSLTSSEDYVKFSQEFQTQLQQNLEGLVTQYIIYLVILFGTICLFIFVITKIMFYPIDLIKKTAINVIQSNSSKHFQIPATYNIFMSDDIRVLFKSYRCFYASLEQASLKKTQLCKDLENILYPQQILSFVGLMKYYTNLRPKQIIIFDYALKDKVFNKFLSVKMLQIVNGALAKQID